MTRIIKGGYNNNNFLVDKANVTLIGRVLSRP